MINLFDSDSGTRLGTLTEEQLQFLIDQLEEESPQDQDYYIDEQTLDMLVEAGGDPGLLDMLRDALGDRDGLEIRWERD
jgi:processive 1,2-diacylglycerol beta-glucosyltransferase